VPEPNQWLVETHSESIILRVLKRIREGSVNPSNVSVLYVNPIKDFGSEILRLRIDAMGKFIDEWPQGCFEETFQEMFF
jgi:predicted ATPase